jgi:hypothetical protein
VIDTPGFCDQADLDKELTLIGASPESCSLTQFEEFLDVLQGTTGYLLPLTRMSRLLILRNSLTYYRVLQGTSCPERGCPDSSMTGVCETYVNDADTSRTLEEGAHSPNWSYGLIIFLLIPFRILACAHASTQTVEPVG